MNITLANQAKARRDKIYKIFSETKAEHDLIHINSLQFAKMFNVNRSAILGDIKYFLENNYIKLFMPKAQVYKLVCDKKIINDDYVPPPQIKPKIEAIESKPEPIKKVKAVVEIDISQIHNNFNNLEAEALKDYMLHRKEIKRAFTQLQFNKFCERMQKSKLKGFDVVEMINTAISHGWQGVFEPKINNNKNTRQLTYKEIDEQNRIQDLRKDKQAVEHAKKSVDNMGEKWAEKYKNINEIGDNNAKIPESNYINS